MRPNLPLHASAARLGAFCWTERRLFEVLGGSVASVEAPAAKLLLDRHASHAAWRAEQWWARLPVLAVVDRDQLLVPPSAGVAAVYDRLAGGDQAQGGEESSGGWGSGGGGLGGVGRLAGVYRVALPRLAGAYRAFGVLTSPVADGPARRTLAQAEVDLESDRAEGEDFVHSLLSSVEAVEAAGAAVVDLERLLVG